MDSTPLEKALEKLEKANAELEPERLSLAEARELLEAYARVGRLVAFGIAALGRDRQAGKLKPPEP